MKRWIIPFCLIHYFIFHCNNHRFTVFFIKFISSFFPGFLTPSGILSRGGIIFWKSIEKSDCWISLSFLSCNKMLMHGMFFFSQKLFCQQEKKTWASFYRFSSALPVTSWAKWNDLRGKTSFTLRENRRKKSLCTSGLTLLHSVDEKTKKNIIVSFRRVPGFFLTDLLFIFNIARKGTKGYKRRRIVFSSWRLQAQRDLLKGRLVFLFFLESFLGVTWIFLSSWDHLSVRMTNPPLGQSTLSVGGIKKPIRRRIFSELKVKLVLISNSVK